jgi:hypothetical protein
MVCSPNEGTAQIAAKISFKTRRFWSRMSLMSARTERYVKWPLPSKMNVILDRIWLLNELPFVVKKRKNQMASYVFVDTPS